jgi:hypothetical protein
MQQAQYFIRYSALFILVLGYIAIYAKVSFKTEKCRIGTTLLCEW